MEQTLVTDGVGDGEGDGKGDGDGDEEGEGERGCAGDKGDGGGGGAFSSCSISFSSLIRPGGSTLYLDAIRPNSKRQRHTSLGCL